MVHAFSHLLVIYDVSSMVGLHQDKAHFLVKSIIELSREMRPMRERVMQTARTAGIRCSLGESGMSLWRMRN